MSTVFNLSARAGVLSKMSILQHSESKLKMTCSIVNIHTHTHTLLIKKSQTVSFMRQSQDVYNWIPPV